MLTGTFVARVSEELPAAKHRRTEELSLIVSRHITTTSGLSPDDEIFSKQPLKKSPSHIRGHPIHRAFF